MRYVRLNRLSACAKNNIREFRGICVLPFLLSGGIDGGWYGILSDEVTLCELDFTRYTTFDGLSTSPSRFNTG